MTGICWAGTRTYLNFRASPPPGVVHISTINSITRSISHSNDISNFTPILSFTTTWLVPLILSAWQLSLLGSGTTNASDALRLVEPVYAKRYTSISRCLQQFQKRHFHPYSFCQIVNTTDRTHRTTNAGTSAASRIAAQCCHSSEERIALSAIWRDFQRNRTKLRCG